MRPKVIVHVAVSADGKTSGFPVDIELFYSLIDTWDEDATLVGSTGILNAPGFNNESEDDIPPEKGDKNLPLLVAIDSKGFVKNWGYWKAQPYWNDLLVLCSETTPKSYINFLAMKKIEYRVLGKQKVDVHTALQMLNKEFNISTLRVESGGILNGVFYNAGLVDEISFLVHPNVVGDSSDKRVFEENGGNRISRSENLRLINAQTLKDIVWLRYEVVR